MEVPEGPDRRGNDKQHQNKVARQLVRHLGDGRFVIEGMILQAHDLGDARLFDAVGHPDLQRRIGVDGAGIDQIAALLEQRQLLAGQHRLVEACLSRHDDAIRGQRRPCQYSHPIADLQGLGYHFTLAILVDQGRHDGYQPSQVGA